MMTDFTTKAAEAIGAAHKAVAASRRAIETHAHLKGYALAEEWAGYDAAMRALDFAKANHVLAILLTDPYPGALSEERPI